MDSFDVRVDDTHLFQVVEPFRNAKYLSYTLMIE